MMGKIAFMWAKSGWIVFNLGEPTDIGADLEVTLAPYAPMESRAPMGVRYEYNGLSEADTMILASKAIKEVS